MRRKMKFCQNIQFAYRKGKSTLGAASLLSDVVNSRLNREGKTSLRTYVVFVDFSKCFDSVCRQKLFTILQQLKVPFKFCEILNYIYQNTECFIRSGAEYADAFNTSTGLPQGCKFSTIGFLLLIHLLPKSLYKLGPKLRGKVVNCLQFSDDLAIIARTKDELQKQMNKLQMFANNRTCHKRR